MRRIKISGESAYYHAMSRTVNGEVSLDAKAKESLRRLLWRVAAFCEVRLLNYCIMDNHFHVLLGIDPPRPLSDQELIEKVTEFYSHPGELERREGIVRALRAGGEQGQETRARLLARMGDLSAYMKTVKQRFSRWYNRHYSRFGTLYSDRFRSVMLEGGTGYALATVAAYIALNPVRAGMTKSAEKYRFSGYAEAMAGHATALAGLREITGQTESAEALGAFRQCLYGKGAIAKADGSGGGVLDGVTVREIMKKGGAVSPAQALRCRLRYITDGLILGREEYVAAMIEKLKKKDASMGMKMKPRPVAGAGEWGSLSVMRPMRGNIYG